MSRFHLKPAIFAAALLTIGGLGQLAAQSNPKPESGDSGLKEIPAAQAEKSETKDAPPVIELSDKKTPSEAEIRKALMKPVEANLDKAPLNKVLQSIAKTTGTNIWLDKQAFMEEGVEVGEPVSHKGKPLAAARLLDRILPPLGLTWIIQDHVVQVTTIIAADEVLITRTYPVGDLIEYGKTHQSEDLARNVFHELQFVQFGDGGGGVAPGGGGGFAGPMPGGSGYLAGSIGWLIDLLQQMTDGPWVDIDGTGGTLSFLNNNLVIRQTHKVQTQCSQIIETIRKFTKGELKPDPVAIRPPHYAAEEDQLVNKALTKPISVKCKDLPLDKFLDALGEKLAIPIHADVQALNEAGVALDEPVTIDLKNLPADSLLKRVLEPMSLCAIVTDGRLVVTTIIASEDILVTAVHDIRDLDRAKLAGQRLSELMQHETAGPWINIDGTGGTLDEPLDGLLVVRQTQKVHKQIAGILADLRKEIDKSPEAEAKKEPADPKAVTTKFYTLPTVIDLTAVQKAVHTLIEPDSWAENDKEAEGVIMQIDRTLVVKNRNDVHAKLKEFLDDLEKAILQGHGGNVGGGGVGGGGFGGGGLGGGGGFGGGAAAGGGGFFRVPPSE